MLLCGWLAGCGGGEERETQIVHGNGFLFAAPAGWKVTRTSHVVSAAPDEDRPELVSVSVFRIARPFRAELWPSVLRELERVAAGYARRLSGEVVSRQTIRVGGRRARRYDFGYRRAGRQLGQRLVFLFQGRREFQLLCRWESPPEDGISSACNGLAESFRTGPP